MHFTNLGGGSVKRGSRNTLQAHLTLDSSMTGVDPRLAMYNKETIKNHLEKRRQRRAVSNIRPRQRFSTITAFHKNDVVAVSNQQQHEEGINSAGSKCPILASNERGESTPPTIFDKLWSLEATCIVTLLSCGQI
mmetsp:Transcript_4018/g.5344  ORF Transcript_4018/g.5344 Transcript_4018/m.5344 type:complete len:135 (-) Transcript_4018:1388-1792(-)